MSALTHSRLIRAVWRARARGADAGIELLVAEGVPLCEATQAVLVSLGDPRGFDVIDAEGTPIS